ncbi:retrovirus-related Pol polyprotein from transposon opus [Trichonephila clavipes]|nr:retrovirus-related Pol polyprotein from transposon opus [Trichonephila clavipes]
MAEEAKPCTAFVTHHGHYQFLCYALRDEERREYLSKVMDQVLVKHRAYCRSYIDDVAVFSKTWEQHMKHLCVVFQTIKVGFTINLKKCNFARRRVKFLGHVVGSGQHSQIPESCFKKSGFPSPNLVDLDDTLTEFNDEPSLWEALPEQDLTFDDYVLVDTDIAVWGALSEAEIVALDHNNTESDENESEELTLVTLSEAKVSLKKLHNFFL